MRRFTRFAAAASLAVLPACSKADDPAEGSPDASGPSAESPAHPASAHSTSGAPVLAKGWSYDEGDLTAGFPDITTIRLGDRIRIWSRAATDWFPMTLGFLDADDTLLASIRLDVPPKGSITGALPETIPPFTKIRIIRAMTILDGAPFEPRIGVAEPELSTDRLQDLKIISTDSEKHPTSATDASGKPFDQAVETTTTEFLKPEFGRDVILDGSTIYLSGSNPWKSRPVSDAEWLDGRIQAYLRGVRTERRNPRGG